jgi:hypothetical protein
MKPQQEVACDSAEPHPGRDAQNATNERTTVTVHESPPVGVAGPKSTDIPTLLDLCYYWILSR